MRKFVDALKAWPLSHAFLFYVFFVSGLIINFFMLCIVPIWFINRSVYRRLITLLTYSHWSQLTWVTEWWSGTDCVLYMDPEERKKVGKEHCLVLMNHSYEIDWLMGWLMVERLGLLGASKVFVKNEMRFAPLIGWAWYFSESMFLRRNWAKDKHVITKQLDALSDYPSTLAVLLYPEGTRFTQEKLLASNKVAREKGYPETHHTLLPRTRGFVLSMKSIKEYAPSINDCTVVFPEGGTKPSIANILRGKPIKACMHIRRIPVEEVPDDDEGAARWLIDLFKKKDDVIAEYLETGKLPGQALPLEPRYLNLINFTAWSVVLGIPVLYLIRYLVTSAPWHILCLTAAVLFLLTYGLNKFVSITEIESSSSEYGREKKKQ